MKSLLFTFFLFCAMAAFSQNVTFDQAQSLRRKNLAEVETFLTGKGWEMTDATEETDEKLGSATFGYQLDRFDSEKALAWITFYTSSLGNDYNRLSIQVNKPSVYSTFLSRLGPNGYKLKKSTIVDGGIKKVYRGSTTTCVVTTSTSEGTYTRGASYSFFFINNTSYDLNFGEE